MAARLVQWNGLPSVPCCRSHRAHRREPRAALPRLQKDVEPLPKPPVAVLGSAAHSEVELSPERERRRAAGGAELCSSAATQEAEGSATEKKGVHGGNMVSPMKRSEPDLPQGLSSLLRGEDVRGASPTLGEWPPPHRGPSLCPLPQPTLTSRTIPARGGSLIPLLEAMPQFTRPSE